MPGKGNKGSGGVSGQCPDVRTGVSPEVLTKAFLDNLYYVQGRTKELATKNDLYMALSYTVRDRLLDHWLNRARKLTATGAKDARVVAYFSAEYLPGPHLGNNMLVLGILEACREALRSLDIDMNELLFQEEEPGLGNGGLGRLASCFMDSLTTLGITAAGYGIRYEFGIFDQGIHDGWQVEISDQWLRLGNPWEILRPELSQSVGIGGHTEAYHDDKGKYRVRWVPSRMVKGVPCDTPVPGFGNGNCNTLRLWKAEAVKSFDFEDFNVGNYYAAVEEKVASETITKVLYPNDEPEVGKKLRLIQQYFFVSCSLQDMIRMLLMVGGSIGDFDKRFTVQLNDTHPSIAVAELMRLLVDEHDVDWDPAWEITRNALAYTNHTLLPEALEKWPLEMFGRILPRHLEIIYEINQRFLGEVRMRFPNDGEKAARLSLIDESGGRFVRMANLATVGSHAVNGVAALHSELLRNGVLRDFHDLWPEKFHNITNGVTPRRWIALANPRLTALITDKIGSGWIKHLETDLRSLEPFCDDSAFRESWRRVKRDNKADLAALIKAKTGIIVDPDSLFDIQVKRIHEYKRQHLNVLHIITLYNCIKRQPNLEVPPRTFIFGGKSAPGYFMAKLIIRLINGVGEVVNNDPDVKDRLRVVFLPNFNVQQGQVVYPAADLSEQISMAGKEASGTGNMKFSMNGALTIGTLDGANVEIREEVGEDNFFLFGLTTEEVSALKKKGYNPRDYYESNPMLREAIGQIGSGYFSKGDAGLFKPLIDSLLYHDDYMLFADYHSYIDSQDRVGKVYLNQERWTRMSIVNVASMGKFSSDRAIREYCDKIWKVKPVL